MTVTYSQDGNHINFTLRQSFQIFFSCNRKIPNTFPAFILSVARIGHETDLERHSRLLDRLLHHPLHLRISIVSGRQNKFRVACQLL